MNSANYWLMKSEPEVYSITDLQHQRETIWDGVRNSQVVSFTINAVRGLSFFYHSNTSSPGIVGLMRIVEIGITNPI
jgi:predicted RNA-binding protein with PUA-like domain